MKIQQEKVVYFIVQCLLFLVSPLLSLILCAVYYKEYISQFFFVLFAFYFGYQTDVYGDLAIHYASLKYFVEPNINPWVHPMVTYLGNEPFHYLFKYLVSFFSVFLPQAAKLKIIAAIISNETAEKNADFFISKPSFCRNNSIIIYHHYVE